MPEEQWQISGGESALSGPDPRRREEEFFLFQREDPHLYNLVAATGDTSSTKQVILGGLSYGGL